MSRKLFVGNLPFDTGEAELQELFARAGTVETAKVMRDMATGRARGFAFVEMSTEDEAQKAIRSSTSSSSTAGASPSTRHGPSPPVRVASMVVATHVVADPNRAGRTR